MKLLLLLLLQAHLSLGFVLTGQLGHFSKLQMGIDESDMEVLRKRIEKQETQYAKLLMEQSKYNLTSDSAGKLQIPESVHIILFLPDTPQQHVHTIEYPKGSGSNILLAFEDEYECHVFAKMLVRDLGFENPCVSLRIVTELHIQMLFLLLLS